jgi:hypothetical protein
VCEELVEIDPVGLIFPVAAVAVVFVAVVAIVPAITAPSVFKKLRLFMISSWA